MKLMETGYKVKKILFVFFESEKKFPIFCKIIKNLF